LNLIKRLILSVAGAAARLRCGAARAIFSRFGARRFPWPTCLGLLLACLGGSAPACAQYTFDYWTTDNGLPQNSVTAITQTRDGYLWLATFDGLVRYDGVRFTVFDKGNTKGLTSNRFTALCEDSAGALWIGTVDGGLTRYQNGQFTSFTTRDGLPLNQVHAIQRDGDGLLITTLAGYAYWRDGRIEPDPEHRNPQKNALYVSPSGIRWVWDATGLHRFADGAVMTYPIPRKDSQDGILDCQMLEDRDGNLWAGIAGDGVYCVNRATMIHYTKEGGLPAGAFIRPYGQDRDGNVWFGTQEYLRGENPAYAKSLRAARPGIMRFKEGRFTGYGVGEGLSSNIVRAVYEDREGTLWVGTDDRGLNRLGKQFIKTYSTADGLVSKNVYPICQDRSGNIWIGAFGGLSRFSQGRFTNFTTAEGMPGPNVQALFEDHEGRLWIGGRLGFMQNGKFSEAPPPLPVNGCACYAIFEDRAGLLWFGTDHGLIRYKDGAVTAYTTADGLPGNDVCAITEDRHGRLWLGTYRGLAEYRDGQIVAHTDRGGPANSHVRAIYEDQDEALWIGTYDAGLYRLKDGRFTSYTVDQGLFSNGAFAILEDGRGNFWMSSNRGIYRVSRQQLNDFAEGRITALICTAYGKPDGMLTNECNGGRQPGALKTPDGHLWFPTQDGVVRIDPEAVPFNPQPPPVLIESVILDRAPLDFAGGIRIKPGQANLEIAYTGLSYTKPQQVRFKYKLVGQDADWIDANTRRIAYYPYLPPGRYTFQVIAANSDGVWNLEGASMQIIVLPAFYQTWWFWSLAALSFIGLGLLIYSWRVRQLKRAKAAQEALSRRLIDSQESERQRIAAELHDSLGQSMVIIKNRAMHGLEMRNEELAFEQLEEIADSANQALFEVREIAHNLRPFQIDRLGLTKAIGAMIKKADNANGIRFTADVETIDGLLSPEFEINFYRIIQESLNNIIKHSAATEARLTIKRAPQAIEMMIEDNGRGFDTAAPKSTAQGAGGFGLIGMAERARILGSLAQIDSTPGQGTRIRLKLNLRNGASAMDHS
jgi:ligand-binding sensor domain-containing protein/signal transduction histidine kinase